MPRFNPPNSSLRPVPVELAALISTYTARIGIKTPPSLLKCSMQLLTVEQIQEGGKQIATLIDRCTQTQTGK